MEGDGYPLRSKTHLGLDQSNLIRPWMTRWNSRSRPIRTGLCSKNSVAWGLGDTTAHGFIYEKKKKDLKRETGEKKSTEGWRKKNMTYLLCLLFTFFLKSRWFFKTKNKERNPKCASYSLTQANHPLDRYLVRCFTFPNFSAVFLQYNGCMDVLWQCITHIVSVFTNKQKNAYLKDVRVKTITQSTFI